MLAPVIGAVRPGYRVKERASRYDYRGSVARWSVLQGSFHSLRCPGYRAPSRYLPSGS
ncbi:hypothetical protein XHV734_2301 [Xanthomonas hortorum pv. vitians]|nr:hypothetical protein XHV734_2301 [Xanthomonas hortorum pv. vitians]